MKKYVPSIKNNNALKDKAVKDLKKVAHKLETGKVNPYLDKESVANYAETLKEVANNLENTIGTGKEDVAKVAEQLTNDLVAVMKAADQDLTSHLEAAVDNVSYTADLWGNVLDGDMDADDLELNEKAKMTYQRKNLQKRLDELSTVKDSFTANERRLEKDIMGYEKDLEELNDAMVKEENERRINDLYRKIQAINSKLDSLNVRRENYSACFNLLDLIYSNANEIVVESDYSLEDLGKAKALLNINRLKAVVSEPEKAISILKRMEKDTKDISERTKNMDEKIFALNSATASVSGDALAYKEELMRKKKEKEDIANAAKGLDEATVAPEEKTTTDVKGE